MKKAAVYYSTYWCLTKQAAEASQRHALRARATTELRRATLFQFSRGRGTVGRTRRFLASTRRSCTLASLGGLTHVLVLTTIHGRERLNFLSQGSTLGLVPIVSNELLPGRSSAGRRHIEEIGFIFIPRVFQKVRQDFKNKNINQCS